MFEGCTNFNQPLYDWENDGLNFIRTIHQYDYIDDMIY